MNTRKTTIFFGIVFLLAVLALCISCTHRFAAEVYGYTLKQDYGAERVAKSNASASTASQTGDDLGLQKHVPSGNAQATGTAFSTQQPITGKKLNSSAPSTITERKQVVGDPERQKASIHEALVTGTHPERLSPMLSPAPFDPAQFAKDPQAYLNVIEPGRVFQCAQPGPDVPALESLGPAYATITAKGSVPLAVKGAPNAPVTFTALDLGMFQENELNTITVQADGTGIARVTFAATKGAINDCHILAGSPLASGKIAFTVNIQSPPVIVSPTQPQPVTPPGE